MNLAITLLLFFPFLTVMGQTKTITGSVVDESGHPIPYATIQSKMMHRTGTAADYQGNYKLEGIAGKDTLVCSHINYQTRIEKVSGNNKIVFRLLKKPPAIEFTSINYAASPIPVKQINSSAQNISGQIDIEERVFEKIEVPARFGTEPNSLQRFIEKIKFPDSTSLAFDATGEYKGQVSISFTVDATGKVSNPFVIRGVDSVLEKVILDALLKMPVWQPALQNGRNVASEQEISIFLNIQQKTRRN
jgi:hypothetical protein